MQNILDINPMDSSINERRVCRFLQRHTGLLVRLDGEVLIYRTIVQDIFGIQGR